MSIRNEYQRRGGTKNKWTALFGHEVKWREKWTAHNPTSFHYTMPGAKILLYHYVTPFLMILFSTQESEEATEIQLSLHIWIRDWASVPVQNSSWRNKEEVSFCTRVRVYWRFFYLNTWPVFTIRWMFVTVMMNFSLCKSNPDSETNDLLLEKVPSSMINVLLSGKTHRRRIADPELLKRQSTDWDKHG